jgi:hypothetical protein
MSGYKQLSDRPLYGEYLRSTRPARWWEEPLWIIALVLASAAVVVGLAFWH